MNEKPTTKKGLRILRRFLIGAAILATLVAILYTEEDWRGKRAWENCKRELAVKGMVLDWNAYIPSPVPDEQNFFAAPKMAEWFVGQNRTNDFFLKLSDKNFGTINSSIGTSNLISDAVMARKYLAWSDQFMPDFDLIRDALKRPYARINGDYSVPSEVPIPNFVLVRFIAQTLAQRSHCYLLLGEPAKALPEVTLLHDYRRLLEGAPTGKPMTLVASMINVAVVEVYAQAVAEGLHSRQWSESQLTIFQDQLADIHLIPFVLQSFRSEPSAVCHTVEMVEPRKLFNMDVLWDNSKNDSTFWERVKNLAAYRWNLIPRGWLYENMVVIAKSHQKIIDVFDPAEELISPRKVTDAMSEIEKSLQSPSVFNLLASIATPNYVRAVQTLAYNQILADLARVACALERYRLAHGEYPETLAALTPQFMTEIPHDIINGQPLHYWREADGRFVLYSVGWNEKDDGGKVVLTKSGSVDKNNGDWVWQYPAK